MEQKEIHQLKINSKIDSIRNIYEKKKNQYVKSSEKESNLNMESSSVKEKVDKHQNKLKECNKLKLFKII